MKARMIDGDCANECEKCDTVVQRCGLTQTEKVTFAAFVGGVVGALLGVLFAWLMS